MKKIISFALIALLGGMLTACGDKTADENAAKKQPQAEVLTQFNEATPDFACTAEEYQQKVDLLQSILPVLAQSNAELHAVVRQQLNEIEQLDKSEPEVFAAACHSLDSLIDAAQ